MGRAQPAGQGHLRGDRLTEAGRYPAPGTQTAQKREAGLSTRTAQPSADSICLPESARRRRRSLPRRAGRLRVLIVRKHGRGTAPRRAGLGPRAAPPGHRRGRPGRHLGAELPGVDTPAIRRPDQRDLGADQPADRTVPSRRLGTNDKSAQMIHFKCPGGTRRPAGAGRRGRNLGSPWRKLGNRSRSSIPGGRHTVARYSSHARGKPS